MCDFIFAKSMFKHLKIGTGSSPYYVSLALRQGKTFGVHGILYVAGTTGSVSIRELCPYFKG